MLCKLGFVIFSLGAMMAGSDNLAVAFAVALIGGALMLSAGRYDDDK